MPIKKGTDDFVSAMDRYSCAELKQRLTQHKVKGRSKLTTKALMYQELVRLGHIKTNNDQVENVDKSWNQIVDNADQPYIDRLPKDIQMVIILLNGLENIGTIAKINKSWNRSCQDRYVWQHFYRLTYKQSSVITTKSLIDQYKEQYEKQQKWVSSTVNDTFIKKILKEVHPDISIIQPAITHLKQITKPIMMNLYLISDNRDEITVFAKQWLPGELSKHALSEYIKYKEDKIKIIEYLLAEILELAGNYARDLKNIRITPGMISTAIENDEELKRVPGFNY